MSYWTRFEVFPGDVRQGRERKTFEADSDSEAITKANEIATQEYHMVGDYVLEEFREVGKYPKPELSLKPPSTGLQGAAQEV
jgi:hypothetical protein